MLQLVWSRSHGTSIARLSRIAHHRPSEVGTPNHAPSSQSMRSTGRLLTEAELDKTGAALFDSAVFLSSGLELRPALMS